MACGLRHAVGQKLDAARLTGMPVNMIQGIAYVLCSTLAAFGGIMISAQVNGAFLGLGDPYLLETVGRDAHLRRKSGPAGDALRESLLGAPGNGDACMLLGHVSLAKPTSAPLRF